MKIFLFILILLSILSCKDVSKTEHDREGNALEETIYRKQKRVIRYDCQGNVISDKVETINSVSKQYSLRPKRSSNLYDFSATNETTSSSKGSIWFGKGVFTLDLAPTVFNIKANEGMNKILWKFSYCNEVNQETHQCNHSPEVKEAGEIFIHIRQERIFEEGIMEVRPSQEQCG